MRSASSTHTDIRAPKPQRNLYLNNPKDALFSADAEDKQSTAIPPRAATPNRIRATLRHLVPKHALFHVRLTVHQISSVPLVHGEFGVRWKFQDIHSVPGSQNGLFKRTKDKGKEREKTDNESTGSGGLNSNSSEDSQPTLPIPSVVVSSGHAHSDSLSSSVSSVDAIAEPKSKTPHPNPLDWITSSLISPAANIASTFTMKPSIDSAQPLDLATTPLESYTHNARGMTPWSKLIEHSARWEHTVDAVVQMDVDRDTTDLRSNELKLVVMQRVVHGDIDAPRNPRLGALYLNLAEYVSSRSVSRRYLLADSKTNATLKLTIQVEYVGGEKIYKAPPLPKSEILGGITGLLESDVHKARPPLLNASRTSSDSSRKKSLASKPNKPFDVRLLNKTEGPASTEVLIDALFNPFVITNRREELTPFTVYKPSPPKAGTAAAQAASARTEFPRRDSDWSTVSDSLQSIRDISTTTTTTTSSASIKSWGGSSQESAEEKQKIHWWQKAKAPSRSTTPVGF